MAKFSLRLGTLPLPVGGGVGSALQPVFRRLRGVLTSGGVLLMLGGSASGAVGPGAANQAGSGNPEAVSLSQSGGERTGGAGSNTDSYTGSGTAAFARIAPQVQRQQMERITAFGDENGWQPLPADSLRIVVLAPEARESVAATSPVSQGVLRAFEVNLKTGVVKSLCAFADVPQGFSFRLHDVWLGSLYDVLESEAYRTLAAEGQNVFADSETYFVESDLHGEYLWRLYSGFEFVAPVIRLDMVLPQRAREAHAGGEGVAPLTPAQLARQAIFPNIVPGRRYRELGMIALHAQRSGWQPLAEDRLRVVGYNGFSNRIETGFEVNLQTGDVAVLVGQGEMPRVQAFALQEAELAQLQTLLESERFLALPGANDAFGLDGYSLLIEVNSQGQYRWRLHWGRIPEVMNEIWQQIDTLYRLQG